MRCQEFIAIKRIHLLSDTEVTDLYAKPEFSTNEQELYFTLSKTEQVALDSYSNTRTRVHFILQLVYFKAKQQFFSFNFESAKNDVKFILKTYYNNEKYSTLSVYLSRNYIRKQKQSIIALFSYSNWASKYEYQIESHI